MFVLKFGGAAVATVERIQKIADIIIQHYRKNHEVVVVVSAMGNTTNELIDLAKQIDQNPSSRELDMLISVGERISMSLLSMALNAKGVSAVSFTGSQSGIITTIDHTNAKIIDLHLARIHEAIAKKQVVIVAGFQGVSCQKEITTLGRGGSDTTAVALGIRLNAEKVIYYKDVEGFFDQDPKHCPDAVFYPKLTYEDALKIVKKGAKILHERALILAEKNLMPLEICSFLDCNKKKSTKIIKDIPKKNIKPVYEITM